MRVVGLAVFVVSLLLAFATNKRLASLNGTWRGLAVRLLQAGVGVSGFYVALKGSWAAAVGGLWFIVTICVVIAVAVGAIQLFVPDRAEFSRAYIPRMRALTADEQRARRGQFDVLLKQWRVARATTSMTAEEFLSQHWNDENPRT